MPYLDNLQDSQMNNNLNHMYKSINDSDLELLDL